ncbi:MAG TPA: ATP-binding protein [Actinomycetales bacterium]
MSLEQTGLPEQPPPHAEEVGHWLVEPTPLAARTLRHEVLARWGEPPPPTRDPVSLNRLALVLSELVTNAVQHGEKSITVRLGRVDAAWLVSVSEAPPQAPRPGRRPEQWRSDQPQEEGVGGRGLAIVAAISDRCGRQPLPDGHLVWALVPETARETTHQPGGDAPAG